MNNIVSQETTPPTCPSPPIPHTQPTPSRVSSQFQIVLPSITKVFSLLLNHNLIKRCNQFSAALNVTQSPTFFNRTFPPIVPLLTFSSAEHIPAVHCALCSGSVSSPAMAHTGLSSWMCRGHFLQILLFARVGASKEPDDVGFSVGRVSEGQFEYDQMNGRMTPRYEVSIVL